MKKFIFLALFELICSCEDVLIVSIDDEPDSDEYVETPTNEIDSVPDNEPEKWPIGFSVSVEDFK